MFLAERWWEGSRAAEWRFVMLYCDASGALQTGVVGVRGGVKVTACPPKGESDREGLESPIALSCGLIQE